MKKVLLSVCFLLAIITACNKRKETASAKTEPNIQKCPFSLSVVPTSSRGEGFGSSIEMAHNKPHEFYVLLTNVSAESQAVWEYWNSWGYQTISFELTTGDGNKFLVSKRQEGFTRNFPSTFGIEPGEHQVYAIRLDEWWETYPTLPKPPETRVKFKAVYQVPPTSEAAQYKVWTGRLESRAYEITLRQW